MKPYCFTYARKNGNNKPAAAKASKPVASATLRKRDIRLTEAGQKNKKLCDLHKLENSLDKMIEQQINGFYFSMSKSFHNRWITSINNKWVLPLHVKIIPQQVDHFH